MSLSFKDMLRRIRHNMVGWQIAVQSKRRPLKIVVGASGIYQSGWIATDKEQLNILVLQTWERFFEANSIDAILAEHVWEHLTADDAKLAAENCEKFLKAGGHLRVAVPDGFFPDKEYIEQVKPMGTGAGSDDHRVLYNYRTISELFASCGFTIKLLEYWDEEGVFHEVPWDIGDGFVRRSRHHDARNKDGSLLYSSLIIDAVKP